MSWTLNLTGIHFVRKTYLWSVNYSVHNTYMTKLSRCSYMDNNKISHRYFFLYKSRNLIFPFRVRKASDDMSVQNYEIYFNELLWAPTTTVMYTHCTSSRMKIKVNSNCAIHVTTIHNNNTWMKYHPILYFWQILI